MTAENKKFLLTIAIPTYNRPVQLARLLKSIIPQLTPEIEMVIRDDSPTNETERVVEEYFKGHTDNLSYYRGKKIGIDAAILFVVNSARGKYIWTFGDDDEMMPGGIQHILGIVKQFPNITFAWASYKTLDHPEPVVNLGGDMFFKDGNDVLEKVTNRIPQISTCIFRKDVVMPIMPFAEKYNGTWFSIMILILHTISDKSGTFYFMQGPYVLNHPPTAKEIEEIGFHNNGFRVFGVNFYNVFTPFRGKLDRKAIRKVLRLNFGSTWRGVVVSYLNGTETTHGKVLKMIKLYWSYPECWIAAPLFLLPKSVLSILYKVYKKIVKHGYRE